MRYLLLAIFTLSGLNAESYKVSDILKSTYSYYPSLKLSSEQVKEAQLNIDSAMWGFYPTPSVDVSARNGKSLTVARVDQPLWTGGKLTSNVDIAKAKKEEITLSSDEIAYRLTESIFNILQTYFQAKYSIEALKKGKDRLLKLNEMLQRRIEAGVSSKSDNDLIASRINQLEADLISYQTKMKIASLQLENFTGEKIGDIVLENNNNITFIDTQTSIDMTDLLLSSNPTLKKLESMVKTASLEAQKAEALIYPNLSLRAEHQRGSLYDNATNTNESLIYLTLQASTGAGLSMVSNIEASKVKILQARLQKQTREKELIDQFLNDLNNFQNAKIQIENRKNTLLSSSNVLESYTRLFIAGRKQWLDLVNASKELTQYETEIASLESYKNILQYKLALQLGKIDLKNGEIR